MSQNNNNNKEDQLKQIALVVMSLINSTKPPCTLRDILFDFQEFEGCPLPIRSLGYTFAEELLADKGEFSFQHRNGETVVTAKPSEKSGHIVVLVMEQNESYKARKSPGSSDSSQPCKRAMMSHFNWNGNF
uniref:HTH OST-type domain-containing protein n=1 Tax=Glossina morsitans morsitans TaxID=37546 RepID=A0A1B0FM89_GLOMM